MRRIKLFDPYIGREEKLVVNNVLKSKFWASGSGIGDVHKFENKFTSFSYLGAKLGLARHPRLARDVQYARHKMGIR